MTAGTPRSASARTSLRSDSCVCCTTPGIDTIGCGPSIPSLTNSGATRSSTDRRCSATRRRSTGRAQAAHPSFRERHLLARLPAPNWRCCDVELTVPIDGAASGRALAGEFARFARSPRHPPWLAHQVRLRASEERVTRPSMVCGSASASTRRPRSRAVCRRDRADRHDERLRRRRTARRWSQKLSTVDDDVNVIASTSPPRTTREVVGDGSSPATVRYTGSTSTSYPRARRPVGQHVARGFRPAASSTRSPGSDGGGNASSSDSATNRSGNEVGRDTGRGQRCPRCPARSPRPARRRERGRRDRRRPAPGRRSASTPFADVNTTHA